MLLSVALALEYEAKCMLAEHRLAAGLTESDARAYIDGLIAMAEPIQTHFRWRPQLHEKDLREARHSFGIDVIRPGEALKRIAP